MDKESKQRILIIDDDKINIMTLQEILGSTYKLYVATNGVRALELANTHLPDIILLDIVMPDMDGFEVITILKSSETTAHIPVIFTTGLANFEDEKKGFLLKAADYITKPFNPEITLLRVKNQLTIQDQLRTIKRLSMTDQLTNIANRRGFDIRFNEEWSAAAIKNDPLSIMMIDIDNFKSYNDKYGHTEGDVILATLAQIMLEDLNKDKHFLARWGGEEFVVILADTCEEEALILAESLREGVKKTSIKLNNGKVCNITISIGVNSCFPIEGHSKATFISGADEALFRAKRDGRDLVRVY